MSIIADDITDRDSYGKGEDGVTILLRSVSVLEYINTDDGLVTFAHPGANDAPEDQAARNDRMFAMNEEDWTDLGSPDLLTIAIYPGSVMGVLTEHVEKPMLVATEIIPSADGGVYVRGLAANGRILWMSETYTNLKHAKEHAYSYGLTVHENQEG